MIVKNSEDVFKLINILWNPYARVSFDIPAGDGLYVYDNERVAYCYGFRERADTDIHWFLSQKELGTHIWRNRKAINGSKELPFKLYPDGFKLYFKTRRIKAGSKEYYQIRDESVRMINETYYCKDCEKKCIDELDQLRSLYIEDFKSIEGTDQRALDINWKIIQKIAERVALEVERKYPDLKSKII